MNSDIREVLNQQGFTILEKIGRGAFAEVYRVQWTKYDNMTFAAKIIETKEAGKSDKLISYCNEIKSLRTLDHKNIISFFNYFQIGKFLILIFEYCPNGSIASKLKMQGPFSETDFRNYALQILDALNCCHNINLTHRDIKPDNILLDQYNRAKLCDFGLANVTEAGQLVDRFAGSLGYLPPEVIKKQPFEPKKADIWSLGVTFYQMITGCFPWPRKVSRDEIISAICNQPLWLPNTYSLPLCKMILSMLNRDPEARPSCQDLLAHPFFTKVPVLPPLKLSKARENKQFMALKRQNSDKSEIMRITAPVLPTAALKHFPLTFKVKSQRELSAF